MGTTLRRSTIYFDPELHRVLRLKSAEMECSVSDLVNEAVRSSFLEDAEDLAAFEEREAEPSLLFADVVQDLRQRGKL